MKEFVAFICKPSFLSTVLSWSQNIPDLSFFDAFKITWEFCSDLENFGFSS